MPIGPMMIDVEGVSLTEQDRELLAHPLIGGVILFTRNYESLEQLNDLIFDIRECRSSPFLVAVDQEGGRVQRFKEGFTVLPALSMLGELYEEDSEQAWLLAEKCGWLMAVELLTASIDLSFAPVLDLNLGISSIIGNRSFHSNPEVVSLLADAFIGGMHAAGMHSVGKHFPGHGSVLVDSHISLPIDPRPLNEIIAQDLVPYFKLTRILDAVMTAHITFNEVDNNPATFSSFWLQQILRNQIGFTGAIFSDDLSMGAAHGIGECPQRASQALAAGCDMILICNNRPAVLATLRELENYSNIQSQQRLLKMCGHFQLTRAELTQSLVWRETVIEIKKLIDKFRQVEVFEN